MLLCGVHGYVMCRPLAMAAPVYFSTTQHSFYSFWHSAKHPFRHSSILKRACQAEMKCTRGAHTTVQAALAMSTASAGEWVIRGMCIREVPLPSPLPILTPTRFERQRQVTTLLVVGAGMQHHHCSFFSSIALGSMSNGDGGVSFSKSSLFSKVASSTNIVRPLA